MPNKTISIHATIHAPIEKVWEYYTSPEHITKWAFASSDWEAPSAENDLRVGGKFKTRMQAKNGSTGFDFTGTYTEIVSHKRIAYTMDDGRRVTVNFDPQGESVEVVVNFEMENQNSEELQRSGWQAILDNFKKHTENE